MGPPSYMRSIVDRNVVMRRISVSSGYRGLFLSRRAARAWRGPLTSNDKVKNEWNCVSPPPYTFKACRGAAVLLPSQNTDIQWIQTRQKMPEHVTKSPSTTFAARQIKCTFYPPPCHSHSHSSRHTITLDNRRGTFVDVSHWVSQICSLKITQSAVVWLLAVQCPWELFASDLFNTLSVIAEHMYRTCVPLNDKLIANGAMVTGWKG
jgi:hypothetical protein